MNEPETALWKSLDAAAEAAFERLGRYEATIEVAGHAIRLGFAGEALRAQSIRSFSHIQVPDDTPGEVELLAWDTVQSGVETPRENSALVEVFRASPPARVTPFFGMNAQGVFAYDAGRNRAYHWLENAHDLDETNKASPLRLALSYALADRGLFAIHAGAMRSRAGGFLLCGISGAGKSTTSLACANAGFEFVSDDFCFVEVGKGVRAHSIYSSAKLFEHRLNDLPAFAALVSNPHALEFEKAISFLPESSSFHITRQMEVEAVILLASKGHATPAFRRIGPVEALTGIAPNTLIFFRSNAMHLRALRDLVTRIPCFSMELAADIEANPPAIESLLDSLKEVGE